MPEQYPSFFAQTLLEWHADNPRHLPWKETDDPYKIWLSEIILQQTQVSQGTPYYQRFVERYPTVNDLASAPIDDVLKTWQGLGYNSRARNLHVAAQTVAEQYEGYFPDSYNRLIELKGVGEYTAAAIASFAFGERVPVVDTNVIRVICRILGETDVTSRAHVRRKIKDFLNEAIADVDPAVFNQAIMNFGAIQCKPRDPMCSSCPLADSCVAFKTDTVNSIPSKAPKKVRRERFFHYLIIHDDSGVIIRQRSDNDIWQGMYDFPLIELATPGQANMESLAGSILSGTKLRPTVVQTHKQTLSHQIIHAAFYELEALDLSKVALDEPFQYVDFSHLRALPVPKVVDCYLGANSILL